jgi:hypothetical protein
MARLGAPDILMSRVYNDKSEPTDRCVIEFDAEKVDPKVLEVLHSEARKANIEI